jgi:hypothetical protein
MTDLLSQELTPFDDRFGINSTFMKVSTEYDELHGPTMMSETDHTDTFDLKQNANILMGASQVAVEYDAVENRFTIPFLHTPVYDATGDVSVGLYKGDLGNYFEFDKHSGVFLTKLESSYADGSKYDLFGDTMGFDVASMLVGLKPAVTDGDVTYQLLDTTLEQGKNITGGLLTLDTFVPKTGSYVAGTGNILSTSDLTSKIPAAKDFSDSVKRDGYFLIEVSGPFINTMIGQTKELKFIAGVLNKYYSYKSFTSGGAEVAIPFVNTSDRAIAMTDIRVRILDPSTMQPSTQIGPDNTLFMQID